MKAINLVGQTLGSYKVLLRYTVGANSEIYSARHKDSDQLVAIKLLQQNLAQDANFVRQFHERVALCAAIDHPNLVKTYESGQTEDGRPYYVTEFVRGEQLDVILAQGGAGPANAGRSLRIFRELAKATNRLAEAGLVHYALTPQNILILPTGTPILLNAAMPLLPNPSQQARHFAAPESREVGRKIEWASHQYSLGLILYELLSAQRPARSGQNRPAGELPPSALINGELTAATLSLLDTCLRNQPWARYTSSAAWLAAIEAAIVAEDQAVKTRASPGYRADADHSSRRRQIVWGAALLGLVLLLGGAYLGVSFRNSTGPFSQRALASAETEEATDDIGLSMAPIFLLEPDDEDVLAVSEEFLVSWRWAAQLRPDQRFVVYFEDENQLLQVAEIEVSSPTQRYELDISPHNEGIRVGTYDWYVALETIEERTLLAVTDPNRVIFVSATATPTATATETATPTATPLPSATPSATASPTVTHTPTDTPTPTNTPTPTATYTPSPTNTRWPTVTPTHTATPSPTPTHTAVPTNPPPPPPTATSVPPTPTNPPPTPTPPLATPTPPPNP